MHYFVFLYYFVSNPAPIQVKKKNDKLMCIFVQRARSNVLFFSSMGLADTFLYSLCLETLYQQHSNLLQLGYLCNTYFETSRPVLYDRLYMLLIAIFPVKYPGSMECSPTFSVQIQIISHGFQILTHINPDDSVKRLKTSSILVWNVNRKLGNITAYSNHKRQIYHWNPNDQLQKSWANTLSKA